MRIFHDEELGTMKKIPKYNVVSLRINDDEKRALQLVSRVTRKSVSQVMREAMLQYSHHVSVSGLKKETRSRPARRARSVALSVGDE